jgi:hypothetical protein
MSVFDRANPDMVTWCVILSLLLAITAAVSIPVSIWAMKSSAHEQHARVAAERTNAIVCGEVARHGAHATEVARCLNRTP